MSKGNKFLLTTKYIEVYLNSINIIKGCCFVSLIDRGIESKNYLISIDDKNNFKYVLKIYPKNNIEELKYELKILDKLNHNVKDKYFPVIKKSIFYINKQPAVLLEYILGHHISKNKISSQLIKKIAKKQAEMHILLSSYMSKYKKNRFSIFDFSFVDNYVDNDKSLYYNILYREIIKLKQESKLFKKIDFKKSIIHEDLSNENIIIDKKGNINFIDFGESHRAEVVSDIAIAIKEIIISNVGINVKMIGDYLDAYQEVNNLNKKEFDSLLFLIKRRVVFMILYLLNKQKFDKSASLRKKILKELKLIKVLRSKGYLIKNFISEYKYE